MVLKYRYFEEKERETASNIHFLEENTGKILQY